MVLIAAACAAVTLANPYGLEFWRYLIPALLHPRLRILEWRGAAFAGVGRFWGVPAFIRLDCRRRGRGVEAG